MWHLEKKDNRAESDIPWGHPFPAKVEICDGPHLCDRCGVNRALEALDVQRFHVVKGCKRRKIAHLGRPPRGAAGAVLTCL